MKTLDNMFSFNHITAFSKDFASAWNADVAHFEPADRCMKAFSSTESRMKAYPIGKSSSLKEASIKIIQSEFRLDKEQLVDVFC